MYSSDPQNIAKIAVMLSAAQRAAACVAGRGGSARALRALCSAPQLRLHPALESVSISVAKRAGSATNRLCAQFTGCSGFESRARKHGYMSVAVS